MPSPTPAFQPLQGVRILSLALNLPGPAALMRCHAMGAQCVKFEPLAAKGGSADPMRVYAPEAYDAMHAGVSLLQGDLKRLPFHRGHGVARVRPVESRQHGRRRQRCNPRRGPPAGHRSVS